MPLTLSLAGSTARPALDPAAAIVAAAACGLVLLWWGQGGWMFPLDDAYITLHNARALIEGRDPSYGVSALIGATSLIHLALVTALSLVLPPEAAGYLVSCAGVIAFLAGLITMARGQGVPGAETAVLVVGALVLAAGQLLNGLETGLVLAAVTWTLVLAMPPQPTWQVPLACGLLPFLRPELGLLALVLMARQAWMRWSLDRPNALSGIFRDAALALAAALPWLAWSWIETGAILPGTLAAKQAFFGLERHALPEALGLAALCVVAGVGPAIGALALIRRDALAVALCAFAGLFVLGFALTTPEILAQNDRRYTFALLPVALFALARVAPCRGLTTLRVMLAAQCAVCALLAPRAFESIRDGQVRVADYRAVSAWAQVHLPPGARVMVHDAGVIAYASDLPLTDLVGLKSPKSVADHRRWTAPSGGAERGRALDAIARRAGATHAIILDDRPLGFWAGLADDMRRAGWTLARIDEAGPEGWYRLYALTPPAAQASADR